MIDDLPVSTKADLVARISRFTCSSTRMLLSGDGLTTPLLEAWLGGPLYARDVECAPVPVRQASVGVAALLRTAGHAELLARRSSLATGENRLVSMNDVTARLDLAPAVMRCLTDLARPLGPALHAVYPALRRTPLDAGLTRWPPEPDRAAAFRTYLMRADDEPIAVIREVFNPGLVPATTREPAP